jgi:hypothetical protein
MKTFTKQHALSSKKGKKDHMSGISRSFLFGNEKSVFLLLTKLYFVTVP